MVSPCSAPTRPPRPLLRSLTEALDIEWQAHGIRVLDVLPLFVNTAMVRDEVSKMKTVKTLGVRLSAEDVAATVWQLARPLSARGLLVHSPVGLQTKLFYIAAKLTPDGLNRWITASWVVIESRTQFRTEANNAP